MTGYWYRQSRTFKPLFFIYPIAWQGWALTSVGSVVLIAALVLVNTAWFRVHHDLAGGVGRPWLHWWSLFISRRTMAWEVHAEAPPASSRSEREV